MLLRAFASLVLLVPASLLSQAVNSSDSQRGSIPVGVRFTATGAKSSAGSCGCFLLTGGAVDAALPVGRSLSVAFEFAGNRARQVPGTQRGLGTLSLLAGPRYSFMVSRRQSVFVQALAGATRGFDAVFQGGKIGGDTATVFSYHVGAAYEISVTPAIAIRPAQLALVQTALPNGTDDRQRNIQFGAGLLFRIHVPSLQR